MSLYLGNTPIANTGYDKANDSDVVKLTGNQTIAGEKTFTGQEILANGFNIYDTRITKGTNPSSTMYKSIFTINDSSYNSGGSWQSMRLAVGELSVDTTGKTDFYFGPYKYEANSNNNALIHCVYDKANNTSYATAPIPTASDNSNKIATTSWVRNLVNVSNVGNRYSKIGGMIIQWGEFSASGGYSTITFPTPFTKTNYALSLLNVGPSNTGYNSYKVHTRQTTKAEIAATVAGSVVWIAIGE